MKITIRKIVAGIAILLGLTSVVVGTRVLMGWFDPGYVTFPLLIIYNVIMGLVSILAGIFIWKNHKSAFEISGLITIGHIAVLVSLVTVFGNIIALQSIHAMIFRSVIWILILLTILWVNKTRNP